jgi:hypothetical protein
MNLNTDKERSMKRRIHAVVDLEYVTAGMDKQP